MTTAIGSSQSESELAALAAAKREPSLEGDSVSRSPTPAPQSTVTRLVNIVAETFNAVFGINTDGAFSTHHVRTIYLQDLADQSPQTVP